MFHSRIFLYLPVFILCLLSQIPTLQAEVSSTDSSRLYLQTTGRKTTMVSYQQTDYMIIRYRNNGERRLYTVKGYLREVSQDSIRINDNWFSVTSIEQVSLPNANGKPVTRQQVNGRGFSGIALALGLQAPAAGGAFFVAQSIATNPTSESNLEDRIDQFIEVFSVTYFVLSSVAILPLKMVTSTKSLGTKRTLIIQ